MNSETSFMLAIATVVLLAFVVMVADGVLYRNTEWLYCDCTVTGKVEGNDSNAVSIACDCGVAEVIENLSDLEYQSVSVGQRVVVTAVRTRMIDDTQYGISLNDNRCVNQ